MASRRMISMCGSSQQAPSSSLGLMPHTHSRTGSVLSPPVASPSIPSPPVMSPSVISPPIASPVVGKAPRSARHKHSKVVICPTNIDEEPSSVSPRKNVCGVCRRIKTTMIANASGRIKLIYDKNVGGAKKSNIHSLLVHDIGAIVRMHSPMNVPSFRKHPKEAKSNLRDFLSVSTLMKSSKNGSRDGNMNVTTISKNLTQSKKPEEARASPPLEFTQSDSERLGFWYSLCDHFMTPKFQTKSAANTKNRKKNTLNYHGGAKLFVHRFQDLREKKDSKFPAVDNFKDVYVMPNNPDATILYEKMQEKIAEFNHDNESQYPPDTPLENIPLPDPSVGMKILTETLEELCPSAGGYVRGLGHGMERNIRCRLSPSTSEKTMYSHDEVKELKEELGNSLKK